MSNADPTSQPPTDRDDLVLRTIVDHARRAPSVHNTQPWAWRVSGHDLELYADRSRQLLASDPAGRELVISCGAALHYALTAAVALGWDASTELQPDPDDPDLLVRIQLAPGRPPPDAARILAALVERRTDRRRFTNWPIPRQRLQQLANTARVAGVDVVPVLEPVQRWRTEVLIDSALRAQEGDAAALDEERRWLDRHGDDGVPGSVARAGVEGSPTARLRRWRTRFDHALPPETEQESVTGSDGLLAIGTLTDDVAAWLRTGAALTGIWLRATDEGLSVVPLSQVTERDESRAAVGHEVFGSARWPQLLVRIGWQEIGRSDLPPTPRRSVDEILVSRPPRARRWGPMPPQ